MPYTAALQAIEGKEDKFVILQIHSTTIGLLTKTHPVNIDTGQELVDTCAPLGLAGHPHLNSDGASETQTQPGKGRKQEERACG